MLFLLAKDMCFEKGRTKREEGKKINSSSVVAKNIKISFILLLKKIHLVLERLNKVTADRADLSLKII